MKQANFTEDVFTIILDRQQFN